VSRELRPFPLDEKKDAIMLLLISTIRAGVEPSNEYGRPLEVDVGAHNFKKTQPRLPNHSAHHLSQTSETFLRLTVQVPYPGFVVA